MIPPAAGGVGFIMQPGQDNIIIGIAGNPNSGKTSLFNALTGGRQKIGNWPGVTVERKSGRLSLPGKEAEVVDLPGIYSLSTSSLDEAIARDFILHEKPSLIINIVDASNIERNLYLTVLLLEMKVPMIVVLNKMDRVRQQKVRIDTAQLEKIFDCPVVPMVANKSVGLEALGECIRRAGGNGRRPRAKLYFPPEVEDNLRTIQEHLKAHCPLLNGDPRWAAIKLLEGDIRLAECACDEKLERIVRGASSEIRGIRGEDPDIIIADTRYGFINSVCKKVVDKRDLVRRDVSDAIDRIVLNRFLGIPLFLLAMYLTFWISVNLGGSFIDFFDILFGTVFVEGTRKMITAAGAPLFLETLLADGIGSGIQTVATFIPPIFFVFLCLAFLEDSGYMARAAFVMDRMMRAVGLPGKAFVPMLLGFGCNVPAIMATRTLEQEKDRILAILMNPMMSCGARLPVYTLFAAAFFPDNGGFIVFALYMIGIAMAVFTAVILKKTILKGEAATFLMELPPYHVPTLRGIFIHTWGRLSAFILKAGQIIILIVVILTVLNAVRVGGTAGSGRAADSVLSRTGKVIVPVFAPMGIRRENWPAAMGIFTGVFAKESVIGTLDALYSQMEGDGEVVPSGDDRAGIVSGVQRAFASVPGNIKDLSMPFALGSFFDRSREDVSVEVEVRDSTYTALREYFDGPAGGFAYLLFILLYMPCLSASAAICRELNRNWMLFSTAYLTFLAWAAATVFYQAATFWRHPAASSGWLAFVAAVFCVFYFALKMKARGRGGVRGC